MRSLQGERGIVEGMRKGWKHFLFLLGTLSVSIAIFSVLGEACLIQMIVSGFLSAFLWAGIASKTLDFECFGKRYRTFVLSVIGCLVVIMGDFWWSFRS